MSKLGGLAFGCSGDKNKGSGKHALPGAGQVAGFGRLVTIAPTLPQVAEGGVAQMSAQRVLLGGGTLERGYPFLSQRTFEEVREAMGPTPSSLFEPVSRLSEAPKGA